MTTTHQPFNPVAEACLASLYKSVGATTTREKINLLEIKLNEALGGEANFYALGGDINDEMKLGCLEYEYLERMGKIDLVLA